MSSSQVKRGQAIVLIALALVGLVGLTGLAIDGGNAYLAHRQAQNAADAAALSAALATIRGSSEAEVDAIVTNISAANGFELSDPNVAITVSNPPASGYYANCASTEFDCHEYIQVVIEAKTETFFAPVVGIESTDNFAQAVTRAKPLEITEMYDGNAMVSLAPTECQAYYAHGTANTYVSGSGIFINSDGSECTNVNNGAFEQQGDAGLIVTDGGINVVGNAVIQNPAEVNINPTTGATPVAYPPDFPLPEPSCNTDATRASGVITPGNIDAMWLRDDVFLNPGLYCIDGDLVLNASNTLEGHDVTLYFVNGGLHINGAGEFLLDAPDSGEFAGLLIYLPMDNDSIVLLNGNADSIFEGTILAPASEIQINGTGYTNGYSTQIIGYNIDLIDTADAYIHYDDANNYDATLPPQIELAE